MKSSRGSQQRGHTPEVANVLTLLRGCIKDKDLHRGTKLHDDILRRGLLTWCSDPLVFMYSRCGALLKAKDLFDTYQSTDVHTWTALIAGFAQQKGQGHIALGLYKRMQLAGLPPSAATFTCILKACGSIKAVDKGEEIHDEISKQGLLENNIVLGNALINMYAKCGALAKARQVLHELPARDVISWTALIMGYAEQGEGAQALTCFEKMQHEGLSPNAVTFISILKACGSIRAADEGKQIHDQIKKQELLATNTELGNALVDMYAKCGDFAKAQQVLGSLPAPTVVCWTALIQGYVQQGEGAQALDCFEQMQSEGFSPDVVTFIYILKACGSTRSAEKGGKIHEQISKLGLLTRNIVLGTALIEMYAKCGALAQARQVLEELPTRDVISWTALITGYVQHDKGVEALECCERMQQDGFSPNDVTFISLLNACGSIRATYKGERIHEEITKQGLLSKNVMLGTALVEMYAKCGALARAREVLEELPVRDVVSWNALITEYVQQGEGAQVLLCYEQMQREGLSADAVTFISVLKACGTLGALDLGEKIHEDIDKQGLLQKDILLGTTLVDMYAKCRSLEKAQQVLDKLPVRDVVSWNALITGYAHKGEDAQALNCYERMQDDGVSPNAVTLISILKACGSIGATERGEEIHHEVDKQGLLENDIVVATALVDMYVKCGAVAKALQVMEELPVRDAISWNALIAGYAQDCGGAQSLHCFEQMQLHDGLSPDAGTFSSVLSACSRLGLVEDADTLFVNMSTKFGMRPDLEHYACMVDLFGRAGHFDKAVQVIEKLPTPHSGVWSVLLAACCKWGDVNVGRWAFEHAVQVDRSDSAIYILMASIYAAADMRKDADRIEVMRRENRAWNKQEHDSMD